MRLASTTPQRLRDDVRAAMEDLATKPHVLVLTRHPDAWDWCAASGLPVRVLWCSPRPGPDRIESTPDAVLKHVVEQMAREDVIVIDFLPDLPERHALVRWVIDLADAVKEHPSCSVMLVLDAARLSSTLHHQLLRLAPLSVGEEEPGEPAPALDEEPTVARPAEGVSTIEPVGMDGVRHLTRLPEGFSVDALRRRLLQWRRMGFDVSDLEPALTADEERMEGLYRAVEAQVRRAVDLERRLERAAERLESTIVERDHFRLRQLSGLDEIEARLDALEDEG